MKIFLTFILMPLIAIVFMAVVWVVSKKNKLLKNKKFIFYVLLCGIILALPALSGFAGYWFMPYVYVGLQVLYLLLGWANMAYTDKHLNLNGKNYAYVALLTCAVMFLGMALFSVVFNLCNELQYGPIASTCIIPFILIPLYRQAYRAYIAIPIEIYNICTLDKDTAVHKEGLDISNLMVVDVELYKDVAETDLLRITAKASENMNFKNWFMIFLTDYNLKNSLTPIYYYDEGQPYGWVFYIKPSFFRRRQYIDYNLTFKENKIKPHSTIIARRAKDVSGNGVVSEKMFK